jgi:hypothetical protein
LLLLLLPPSQCMMKHATGEEGVVLLVTLSPLHRGVIRGALMVSTVAMWGISLGGAEGKAETLPAALVSPWGEKGTLVELLLLREGWLWRSLFWEILKKKEWGCMELNLRLWVCWGRWAMTFLPPLQLGWTTRTSTPRVWRWRQTVLQHLPRVLIWLPLRLVLELQLGLPPGVRMREVLPASTVMPGSAVLHKGEAVLLLPSNLCWTQPWWKSTGGCDLLVASPAPPGQASKWCMQGPCLCMGRT